MIELLKVDFLQAPLHDNSVLLLDHTSKYCLYSDLTSTKVDSFISLRVTAYGIPAIGP